MTATATQPDLQAAMRRLTVAQDGDEYIIGRPDRGLYVAVPKPGAVIVEALRDGASLSRAAELAAEAAGEEVDAADFLAGLRQAGLVGGDDHDAPGTRIGWVERIPRAAVQPLFGRVAWLVYAAAAITVVTIILVRPDVRPIFDDLWFLTDPIWSVLAMFVISVVITAGHECWHWLAGRALGVPARFRVSRRGVFVVFETDLSELVTLPRRARYSPMLAGIAFDIVLLAMAMLMRLAYREEILHHPPAVDRFLGALVFRQIIVLVWQLSGVAFRADSYAILANALRCHNLYRATALTARYRLRRLSAAEAEELAGMGARDRAVASWFWLVYLAGGFAMFTVFATYLAPFAFGMIVWIAPNITGLGVATLAFWQSILFATLLVAQYAAVPVVGWFERRRAVPPPASTRGRVLASRYRPAWQAVFVVFAIWATWYAAGKLLEFVEASPDASRDNAFAAAHDDSCLPGVRVHVMDFPHISQLAAPTIVYNSNPASSGPHYGAAVAPGIYRSPLAAGQWVHALEHGRVVIHYRPDTPPEIVARLESIAKRHARETVVHPNPGLDAQIALTTWGRLDKLDTYDEARVARFVELLRGRYNHHATAAANECAES